ncbi:MAG: sulfurtransferase TusA family protein [Snowella sp.]|nr:sulfurtransferase TusA family protein [Snowella sp.]
MADQTLDVKNLNDPMPLLKTKKTLATMAAGDVLTVEATDPSTVKDFQSFCAQTGNVLLESTESGGVYSYLIRKS